MTSSPRPGWKDKALFTPGPLTTSRTVKQAMLRDLGSRDFEFIAAVRDIRRRLLELSGVGDAGYEAILMQGSGTSCLEAVVSSTIPPDGKLLVIINGAYGRRIAQIASVLGIGTKRSRLPWRPTNPSATSLSCTVRRQPASSTPWRRSVGWSKTPGGAILLCRWTWLAAA